jgi:hypothetical protein
LCAGDGVGSWARADRGKEQAMTAKRYTVEAAHGLAVPVPEGGTVKVVNPHGTQVVDTWAFVDGDMDEHVSIAVTRRMNYRLQLRPGDILYSNRRRPLMTVLEDSSPGVHDMLFTCCDRYTYELLGCESYHRNCADNLVEALAAAGLKAPRIPDPWNLFMNIPVSNNVDISIAPPVSRPGDYVALRAERPCILAVSSCPMDLIGINGGDQRPREVLLEVAG